MQGVAVGIPRMMDLMAPAGESKDLGPEKWQELRKKAQEKVMRELPPEYLGRYRDPQVKERVSRLVSQVVENELIGLPYPSRTAIIGRLTDDINGYGPLEPFLDDPEITEIIVERYDTVGIDRNGKYEITDIEFDGEEHLRLVLERIIAPLGRRLDWASPVVDARLPDGSRVCALIPPVAVDGAQVTIRKFRPNVSMNDLINWEMLPASLAKALAACVKGRLSMVISGGTGSGKTTFMNALSEYVPEELKIITIENPVELQLRHKHVRRWEARPANIEGKGEIDMMSLVITALRSYPDIIVVGEVRGREAWALIQALNTGHPGSMTTLHANNTAQAMERLVSMVASAGELAKDLVPAYIADSVDVVVHIMRMADGKRRVIEVSEIIGEQAGRILHRPLVRYKVDRFTEEGIEGHWEDTGEEFSRKEALKDSGIEFPGWLGR